ncbi:uncharacterized protein A4U43_C04F2610 [Asparagus officinalis]|uniref:DUF4378 domain-containing protein n=1 Tax=Asparagus officinalis TaxID=4686 RepID=A0A5P1EZI6_ASPOF|nr:uncharacterized protein LOC109836458 [Asparagus officinalis]ONK70893.1 uncharacterized protein A4U43_C04F2610 [Asparagus officinalis]
MGGSKLLADKSHRDGSPSYRSRNDIKKCIDHGIVYAEDKRIASDPRKNSSSKKSGGTPMKMLMAQEMSKETESRRKQTNVVARLMGLDEALPAHQSVVNGRSSRVTLAGALQNSRKLEDFYFDNEKQYRDIYEVRNFDIQNERRMALVRQKFMEAKRLATDERLLQSKEFQDALEVLSSNRDLFLKFLEEPNSLFSKHLKELSTPAVPQTKRITILKPSRTVEMRGEHYPLTSGGWDNNKPQRSSTMNQPTRIVVLKPSPRKRDDTKSMIMPYEVEEDDLAQAFTTTESIRSKDIAEDITQQMRESFSSNRRDDSLLSSVLSNGYVGDESSFNRSENDFGGDEDRSFSDLEIPTSLSRHSWDCSNRYGSPSSFSSFSRASGSPEPSVIREAKKRLSERWSLVTSNEKSRGQMERGRSSNTLGEMLSIPEVKKEEVTMKGIDVSSSRSFGGEQELRMSSSSMSTSQTKDGDDIEKSQSPSSLSRSRSLPVSSGFKNVQLNSEDCNSQVKKPIVVKDSAKSKSGKSSSFKGKVSSLFFSRNKKGSREKSFEPAVKENVDLLHQPEAYPPFSTDKEPMKVFSPGPVKDPSKQGNVSFREILSLEKPSISEGLSNNQNDPSSSNNITESQNQPSPTSVLDAPFENDTSNTPSSCEIHNAGHSLAPIASIARTLSWDDTILESSITLHECNEEEQQRYLFVQNVLSNSGLDKENLNSAFARWHSVNTPLDPVLLNKFLNRKEEDAKSREKRSNQRLLFDCINFALLELGKTVYVGAYPWPKAFSVRKRKACAAASSIGDQVWLLVSDWFSGEGKFEFGDIDYSNLVVDILLRREVGGNGWEELIQSEIEEISKDISSKVLDELVREALAEL